MKKFSFVTKFKHSYFYAYFPIFSKCNNNTFSQFFVMQLQLSIHHPVQDIPSKRHHILKRKYDLMILWVCFLYSAKHRVIMNLICDYSLNKKPLLNTVIEVYHQGMSMVQSLEQGFMVVTNTMSAITEIKPNPQFYDLMPQLLAALKREVRPLKAKIQGVKPDQPKKRCTNCLTQRTAKQIAFLGFACECHDPNYIEIFYDEALAQRIQQIQWLICEAIRRRQEIEQQQEQLNNILKKMQQAKKNKPRVVKQYEEFVTRVKNELIAANKYVQLQMTAQRQRMAFETYRPKNHFEKVARMKEINEKRIKNEHFQSQ